MDDLVQDRVHALVHDRVQALVHDRVHALVHDRVHALVHDRVHALLRALSAIQAMSNQPRTHFALPTETETRLNVGGLH